VRVFFQFVRRVSVAFVLFSICALGLSSLGCQDPPEIRLVPVFPADEPDLLERAGVVMLELQPRSAIDPETNLPYNENPQQTLVEQGDGFALRLPRGEWWVEVVGVDAGGNKVVHGQSSTFRVARGKGGTVKLFIGRSMAFNLVELDPPEVADALGGLREHTATTFTDDGGHPWILVAGGRQPDNPDEPVALALLIDPVTFTIEQLPSLSCARSGHTGFAVQAVEGTWVVLSGGDEQSSTCRSSLDVYDPISRTFQRIDPFGADDRVAVAVPEIEGQTSTHTGKVVVSGKPRYVVDLLTGEPEAGSPSTGPGDPRLAALNLNDQILVMTKDTLFVDEANEKGVPCDDDWDDVARFGPVEERRGGELYALNNEKFFYVGGLSADGTEPELGWSLVSTGSCSIDDYTDGRRLPGPLLTHGFSLIDMYSDDRVGVLLAGGWSSAGEPVSRVVLMILPSNASVPTFHEVSSGNYQHTIALRQPRAGHAAAQLPHDNTWWVIGGAEGARPEIFVRGTDQLVPTVNLFNRRRPSLTSMTVVDTSPGTGALNSDLATSFPTQLYAEQAEFSTLEFVTADADRGIKDGAFAPAVNKAGCDEVSEPSYKLVVSGVVPNEDQLEETLGDDVLVIPYEGQTSPSTGPLERAMTNLNELASDESGCVWRQLLKVGLDGFGLTRPGGDFDPGVPLSLGVNVLVLVTADDDCSQNIYGLGVPPSEVSSFHCTSDDSGAKDAFDDYFGLPPAGDVVDEFESLIDGLTWDDSDLIVAVVGNTSHPDPADCETGGYSELLRPRRLIDTVSYIEQELHVQAQLVDVCGGGDKPAMVEALEAVVDRVRGRNPWQACVPDGITDVQPEYDYDDGDLRLVAVAPTDEKAQQVKSDVSNRCWLVYEEDLPNPQFGEASSVWRGVTLPVDAWRIGTNFDDTAEGTGCEWIVKMDPQKTSGGKDVDFVEIVCLP